MIPGLDLDPESEERMRQSFAGWADHFRQRLTSGGIPSLLLEYQSLIVSLETQSCSHASGLRNTGPAWRACCGISYEYLNDLSVRDALQVIMDSVSPTESCRVSDLVEPLDARLRVQLFGSDNVVGESELSAKGAVSWWRSRLPEVIEK